MSTMISVRGLEDVHVDATFNLVRQRLNQILTSTNRAGDSVDNAKPLNDLTFKEYDSGARVCILPEHVIAIADMGGDEDDDDE